MTGQWPAAGEVNVRLINLAVCEADLSELESLLTPHELERANKLAVRQVRNRFVAGRGLLRKILGSYMKLEPGKLTLNTNQYGKPFLVERLGGQRLNFSLSHSADLAILALTEDCEIGIDLERIRNDLPFQTMAQQFFSRREQADLFSLPAELQLAAFYRCWTRKEAYLKGVGSGFSQPANSCDVSLLPNQPPALLAHRTDPEQFSKWSLIDLDVPEGFCAALAAQIKPNACNTVKISYV